MLDGNDKQNFSSLMQLRDVVSAGTKPLIFWIGAGCSKWKGYPLWMELAENLHSAYSRQETSYSKGVGARLLMRGEFPRLFSLLQSANSQRYYRTLASTFSPLPTTPVYEHFLEQLRQFSPLHILTTNVDESLEQNLPQLSIVQRTDF